MTQMFERACVNEILDLVGPGHEMALFVGM